MFDMCIQSDTGARRKVGVMFSHEFGLTGLLRAPGVALPGCILPGGIVQRCRSRDLMQRPERLTISWTP
jgi:hypothetical protein